MLCSILSVVSAILLLGNVTYCQSKDTEVLEAGPAEVLSSLSHLLMVILITVYSGVYYGYIQ